MLWGLAWVGISLSLWAAGPRRYTPVVGLAWVGLSLSVWAAGPRRYTHVVGLAWVRLSLSGWAAGPSRYPPVVGLVRVWLSLSGWAAGPSRYPPVVGLAWVGISGWAAGPARERRVGFPRPLLSVGLGRLSAVFIRLSGHVWVGGTASCCPAVYGTIYDFNLSLVLFFLKSFILV